MSVPTTAAPHERGEHSEGEAEAAQGLGQVGEDGHGIARRVAARGEELPGSADAAAPEPAEELLRAVRGHGQAEDEAQEQQAGVMARGGEGGGGTELRAGGGGLRLRRGDGGAGHRGGSFRWSGPGKQGKLLKSEPLVAHPNH